MFCSPLPCACYAGALTFEFLRFRFHFRAAGTLHFPPGKAGNVARGAFGGIFRRLVCLPSCAGVKTCDARATCPYARVFEPQAAPGEGPSGLANRPRPFVFRASHLDGCTIPEGAPFHFDVHLFDVRDPALPYFIQAFTQLAQEGLGPGRGRAELTSVDQLDSDGLKTSLPNAVELGDSKRAVERLRVRFVTPTELKGPPEVGDRPEFGILFARLRDRISTLRAFYGAGPLEIDFRAMGERAAAVRMTHCEVTHTDTERRSSRTGQRHSLGGFVGEAEYEGDLGGFVSYLRLGKWVGVGRQTVWGKGVIEIME
jgi:CRISPR-associated endoribonuclease Cas6